MTVCLYVVRQIADRHPLKQGLKQILYQPLSNTEQIADRHPLKQGLKQEDGRQYAPAPKYRRPTSIKTRIETRLHGLMNR